METYQIWVCKDQGCPGWFDHDLEASACGICGTEGLIPTEVIPVAEVTAMVEAMNAQLRQASDALVKLVGVPLPTFPDPMKEE